jgi:predicted TIM-barrel fold metal-dependent hydrolase
MRNDDTRPVVDVHAHFVTPWYAEEAIAAGHALPDGMPAWPEWTPEAHLRLMDAHGIDQAVLSISSPGVHFGDDDAAADLARRVNDFASATCAKWPDRFRFFAALPLPAVDAALAEAARGLDELGAAGVAVETNAHGHYLNESVLEPVLAELDRRAAVVFVHPTSPPGWERTALGAPRPLVEFLVETTRTAAALLIDGTPSRYPSLQLIVTHCAAFLPLLADRLKLFAGAIGTGGDGAVIDDGLSRLWYDLAGTPMPRHAEALIAMAGSEHLLYGSDYCWTPPPAVAAQIASLDEGWRRDVHGPWRELVAANAARLLPATLVDRIADDAAAARSVLG